MVKVIILTNIDYPLFSQQFDDSKFSGDFCFYENSSEDIEWDLVVVFEEIKSETTLRCKKGGLVFISAEPPMSSVYANRFIKQFDTVFSAHPKIDFVNEVIRQQCFYDWHFGFNAIKKNHRYSFEEITQLKPPVKSRNISVITSSLTQLPFHIKRVNFVETIRKLFPGQIDFFGRGINMIPDKAEGILPYRFHICIENACIDDYWTEKFADPVLGYSVPIYCGCTNMEKYFSPDSFYQLDINDIEGSINFLKKILDNPEKAYNDKLQDLISARERILHTYNIFPALVDFIHQSENLPGAPIQVRIRPNSSYAEFPVLNYHLRFKRLSYKLFHNLISRIR